MKHLTSFPFHTSLTLHWRFFFIFLLLLSFHSRLSFPSSLLFHYIFLSCFCLDFFFISFYFFLSFHGRLPFPSSLLFHYISLSCFCLNFFVLPFLSFFLSVCCFMIIPSLPSLFYPFSVVHGFLFSLFPLSFFPCSVYTPVLSSS